MLQELRTERQGFTLIEILAVIIIMSIVAGLLVAAAIGARGKADRDAAQAGISYIAAQIEAYMNKRGQLPPNLDPSVNDFTTEVEIYTTLNNWNYPVPPAKQADPWGNPYIIVLGRDYGKSFPLASDPLKVYVPPPDTLFTKMPWMYASPPADGPKDILDENRVGNPPFNDQPNGFQVISAGPDGRVSRNGNDEVNADNFANW